MTRIIRKPTSLVLMLLALGHGFCFCLPGCGSLSHEKTTTKSTGADEFIVFSRQTDGFWQLWRMDVDGTNARPLTNSAVDKRDPAWVENGQRIVYRTNNGRMFIMDKDGRQHEQIMRGYHNINNPVYSAALRQLVFVTWVDRPVDSSDLWKTGLRGENPTLITRDRVLKYQPAVSPQGHLVAFVRSDLEPTPAHNIWLVKPDGSEARQFTFERGRQNTPEFSPDGNTLAISSNHENDDYEIYLVDIATGKLIRLTRQPGLDTSPTFSPDGKDLLFVSTRSGQQQISRMQGDGSNIRQLTTGSDESVDPVWIRLENNAEVGRP